MTRRNATLTLERKHPHVSAESSSTFVPNMALPVHRWFRFSAGFSAQWAESAISEAAGDSKPVVLDPFCGSGTTLLAAEQVGARSYGVESHPFVLRIARAKLGYRTGSDAYVRFTRNVRARATRFKARPDAYPPLVQKCFTRDSLSTLDQLRRAWESLRDGSPASELAWLTLLSILRPVSHVGTAPWQYILPRKTKRRPAEPMAAFDACIRLFEDDMLSSSHVGGPNAILVDSDARSCTGVPANSIDLVLTSPPYPNNFDYADATRLEMTFMREIDSWSDLQGAVRRYLVRSCSQHVSERSLCLEEALALPGIDVIREAITKVCTELARVREGRGGRKSYHLMVACYFSDMALVWKALREKCRPGASVCFVIGDSAPYGVYVPVVEWMGALAAAAGFRSWSFEKTRDRNIKWKNRKHRVPLCEGRLRVER